MPSLFDGMAGLLSDVLGDPVQYTPVGSSARPIQSIFRSQPIDAISDDGRPIIIFAPTWRVRKDLVPELAQGDRIEPGDGNIYAIRNFSPSGSPASDAFIICELEKIFK